jgi:CRP/FNR family transcriptional regulator
MPPLDLAVNEAIRRSRLAVLPTDALGRLTGDALRLELPAGSIMIREGGPTPMFLVVAGLVRGFLTAPSGRQSTVRYCKPGDLIGVVGVFFDQARAGAQTLTETTVLAFNVASVRRAAGEDARIAMALGKELADRLQSYFDQLYGTSFGTVRQRVVRHLLDLAGQSDRGGELVAPVSQQALADAVGSVREVIARVLQTLRREGLIATGPAGIVLLEPLRLLADAWSREL